MNDWIFILIIFVSAFLSIHGRYIEKRTIHYIFKPLTTILIIVYALRIALPNIMDYGYLILAGLLFSLVGDIFLMLPQNKFIEGLVSFLIAHVLFLIGFVSIGGVNFSYYIFLPYIFVGSFLYYFLFPGLKNYKISVLLYLLIIFIMSWQAFECYRVVNSVKTLYALIGTFFFIFSDFIIALNKFRYQFKSSQILILSTYYVSLVLIATSI